jgi:lysozyme family protein
VAARNREISTRRLLVHEGGYTNHPKDPGGPTNFGITIYDYRKYKNPAATALDIRRMQLQDALDIYHPKYWDALRCDELPDGLDDSVFDYGVNSGIGRAGKVLRRILGMSDATYIVTDQVLAEIRKRDTKKLITALNAERLRFLKSLKTWPDFGVGWGRRVTEVNAFSLHLLDAAGNTLPLPMPAPPITAPANDNEAAKGQVPAPTGLKKTIGTGVPAGSTGTALTFHQWIISHPWESAEIAGCVVLGTAVVLSVIHTVHAAKQEAPTPGLQPVPLAA